MLRALTILIISLAVILSGAQFEVIKDITDLPGDITAAKYPYKDVNGDWCGILKIRTEIKDLQFKSIGYEKHDFREGYYYVYLQPGSKNLTFIKEGYITLPYNFSQKIVPNTVYGMEIRKAKEESILEDISISVLTYPAGAKVIFDDIGAVRPDSIRTFAGRHILNIFLDGYIPVTDTINVTPDSTLFKYELKTGIYDIDKRSNIKKGTVQIAVIPKDAGIYIKGGYKKKSYTSSGSSNFEAVDVGEYDVRVSKKGFKDEFFKIKVTEGSLIRKSVKLKECPYGGIIDMIFVKGKGKLRDYYIGATEVTNEQYNKVMSGVNRESSLSDMPVSVTWYEAVEFCNRLSEMEGLKKCYRGIKPDIIWDTEADGYRLQTSQEWQLACESGRGMDELGFYDKDIVFNDKQSRKEHPVRSMYPNDLGIYGLITNASEWCWNCRQKYDDGMLVEDSEKDCSMREVRRTQSGDSFSEVYLRSVIQYDGEFSGPDSINRYGFRVAMNDKIK